MQDIINNNKKLICDALDGAAVFFKCGEPGFPDVPYVGDLIPDQAKEGMKNGLCNAMSQIRSTFQCDLP